MLQTNYKTGVTWQSYPTQKGRGVYFYCYKTTLTPCAQEAETLIISPLPLTLEPSAHDHHLPFYLFPLNKKEKYILNQFTVLNIIQLIKIKMREKYFFNFNDL